MAAATELLRLTSRAKKDEVQWFNNNDSNSESEEEVDHEDLLKKIKSLNKREISKRHKGALRSELNQQVSEFHLKSEGDDGHIRLGDLVGSLQASSYHSKLKKSLESLQKMGHTVEIPLAKPAAERIKRVVAYEETSKDISKWDSVVQKNRQAEQLSFPLDAYQSPEMSVTTLATTFKPRTPLEQEIASVLQNSSQILEREDKELSLEEENALKNMSLEEALERRHELQKLRALQSYYEQKCRRTKKIKSKKYHRIKKRAEKRAASKQTFEQLQKENPELAQAELEKAEKLRIAERMSLKHRNTSKWAKNIIAKGVNDVQARQALSEQLRISRQLTETKTAESDSDEDEANKAEDKTKIPYNFRNFALVGDVSENPWLLNDGKGTGDTNEEAEAQDSREGRLRKLKPLTVKDTEEYQDGEQNEEDSEGSDQDEKFELKDENEVKEGKRTKIKKKNGVETKKGSLKKGKKKKVKERNVKNIEEEVIERKEKKAKRKKGDTDGNIEKRDDAEKKTEQRKKRVKRKSTEEGERTEKSQNRTKKAKLVNSGIEKDILEEKEPDSIDNEELLMEGDGIEDIESSQFNLVQELDIADARNTETVSDMKNSLNLNPKNVFQIEDLGRPNDLLNYTSDSDNETHAQRMTIREAFANDDVIEEFVKEREDAVEASKPKDLDLCLPGWGDWGGPGIDETKRKKKFIVPAKPAVPRKDTSLAHVIINEDRDKKFAKYQVSQLPFPFTSRDQWERSVRVPLGKDWNTTSVHQKLVKPRVVTLPGTIIEPIKPAKGVQQSAAVEDSAIRRRGKRKGAKTMGSGIEVHN